VVVKTVEGLGERFVRLRPSRRALSPSSPLGDRALAQEVGQESLVKGMDYREYGGACLLGVKGNIIAAHGRSQASAITNAIGLAIRTAEQHISEKISREVTRNGPSDTEL
jgi:glycerol-3-phosphate acyltransferase PlsX